MKVQIWGTEELNMAERDDVVKCYNDAVDNNVSSIGIDIEKVCDDGYAFSLNISGDGNKCAEVIATMRKKIEHSSWNIL